ncbi:MAG: RNA polymerase factor sigma-54 [Spirochaetia bacterium]|jgi:RNA polymerase sigma-54 factor|nr:RNA polymerase factor sigma-54 [Spirochaetia bacterium]
MADNFVPGAYMTLYLGLEQSQKLSMTQSLRQSIEMLQLSTVELAEKIAAELLENPVLEEASPADLADAEISANRSDDYSFYEGARQYQSSSAGSDKKQRFIENIVSESESLSAHLLAQSVLVVVPADDEKRSLMQEIITSLDSDGFFTAGIEETALEHNMSPEDVRDVISAIQAFDPLGCASSCVNESLLVQAKNRYPEDKLLHGIIAKYFADVERLNYDAIAAKLKVDAASVREKGRIIQTLDPFPGRGFSKSETAYIIPDADVKLFDDQLIITLNDEWIPKINIDSYYTKLAKNKSITKEQKEYIQEKLQSAKYFIGNISNRRNTLLNAVRYVMEYQIDFLRNGRGNLKPLTMAAAASALGVHESTVSRIASGKYIQTPRGVFKMKHFFVSAFSPEDEAQSADRVRCEIMSMIGAEDPAYPLIDEDIALRLKELGIDAARRTVAKYRGKMNIPSAGMRKKINMMKFEEA